MVLPHCTCDHHKRLWQGIGLIQASPLPLVAADELMRWADDGGPVRG